jgi:uncharacterized membrane protein
MNIEFLIISSIGLVFVIAGLIMKKFPPKKINDLYGYRTKTSMRDQETWDRSQIISAKLMIIYGAIYVLVNLILSLLINDINTNIFIIYTLISLIGISIIMIYHTEKKIKQ